MTTFMPQKGEKLFLLAIPVPEVLESTPNIVRITLGYALQTLSDEEIVNSLAEVPEGTGRVGLLVYREV